VGYLAGAVEVTRTIESIRLPQNMTAFGLAAACRALADQEGLQQRVAAIIEERTRFESELHKRSWQTVPSHGNFVLAKPPRPAVEVSEWLQKGGLIVRSYAGHPRLSSWLRLSVRSPEEDDRLLRRLDEQR
jgi:histidinol-phosphate aminotransferase